MPRRSQDLFVCIRTQGGLFPPDFLARLADPAAAGRIDGLRPEEYHLGGSVKLTEAISRSWNALQGRWKEFKGRTGDLLSGDAATGLTRDLWLLPLFQELGYGRLQTAPKFEIEDRHYPVSHLWSHTPIHLLGSRLDLDKRTAGAAGAARTSPHAMLQEFLNRSEAHLWGILSNGNRLRLLRDNSSLTRQAFVEFDLYSMFEGEAYSDFALLWLLCHQSRVEGERPETCWLEKWTQESRKQGVRLLDGLRSGVEQAIERLGAGFLAHPDNQKLRECLRAGTLPKEDYYRQVLRVVYRLLFLFVAEDRDLLNLPELGDDASKSEREARRKAREQYRQFYSTRQLRTLSERHGGSRHGDRWEILKFVTRVLGSAAGCSELALPPLGSYLWRTQDSTPDLAEVALDNRHLLDAIRGLATVRSEKEKVRRLVDYRNLGPEELGSVYESLLELHPEIHAESATFKLNTAAGNERKTTGSYYTPDSLVQCLLDSALEPVVKERLATGKTREDKEKALLSIKVCDPAVGSGHFLIAAGHRLAKHLAALRSGDEEASPLLYQHALRDVVGRCLYGVDINPMSAELCRINLWLEALEPGKPLSFLDHHVQCGNSLIGATPALIQKGLPDGAFEPVEGDEKEACRKLKRRNQGEREGLGGLFTLQDAENQLALVQVASAVNNLPEDSVVDVQRKEQAFHQVHGSSDYKKAVGIANLWCAAFVIRKVTSPRTTQPLGITTRHLIDFAQGSRMPEGVVEESQHLAHQYQFFHWHLAFPEVFQVPTTGKPENSLCGWNGGFDVMLGNPPWEKVNLKEQEWFAERRPEIAKASNAAARKRQIEALKTSDPALFQRFSEASRQADGGVQLLRNTGLYPLCGRGDVNLYAVFAEFLRDHISPAGRVGCVVPSGIATDDTTKCFFQDLVDKGSLVSLFDFENRNAIFPGVHRSYKFCLLTFGSPWRKVAKRADFVFFALGVEDLRQPERCFVLGAEDIAAVNPNSRTCPVFRFKRDAEITSSIHGRIPIFIREGNEDGNPWQVVLCRMLHMADDSHLFRTEQQLLAEGGRLEGNHFQCGASKYSPLYEAKMLHQFDHRWTTHEGGGLRDFTYKEKTRSTAFVLPRYWVSFQELRAFLAPKWERGWLFAFRDICRTTDERTVIATIVPRVGVGHTAPLIYPHFSRSDCSGGVPSAMLQANLSSFCLDYCARQKIGGTHLTYGYFYQLPLLPPAAYTKPCLWVNQQQTLGEWVLPRVLELTYTAWDLEPFARDCGYGGLPFRWDEERRFLLRCELDAAFFHLYGIARDDVAYIMDTFPIVRRKDEEKWGAFRTKDTILEILEAFSEAQRSGKSYQTHLVPPPADQRCCHSSKSTEA